MPRSPAEGTATRGPYDLEIAGSKPPTRDRRVRSGTDRRLEDIGPPNGLERRSHSRRSHDRRSEARIDRRTVERRTTTGRRGVLGPATSPISRPTMQDYARVAPRSRTPRLLRALVITAVALACLLAATLTGPTKARGAVPKQKTFVVHAASGTTKASLSFTSRRLSGFRVYSKLRLTVKSPGRATLQSLRLRGEASEAWLTKPELSLAEVTGDGVVDAVVQVYTGGAHCCTVSAVAPSTTTGWAKPIVRNWADYGYELRDLGGTPQLEFSAYDSRFTGAYTSYAGSSSPLQVFRLQDGVYVDVTREFPDWIKADVAKNSQRWNDAATQDADVRAEDGRGAAAAWIADLLLLGDTDGAKAVVAASIARGDFTGTNGVVKAADLLGQLGHDLKDWGYLQDPTTIGLTDAPVAIAPPPVS